MRNPPNPNDALASMPSDIDAEAEVLGAVMSDPTCMPVVIETGIQVADFYLERNAVIWRAMLACYEADGVADPVRLVARLKATGNWERAGEAPHLSRLLDRGGYVGHVPLYAETVMDKARLREIIEAARDIEAASMGVGAEPDAIRALVERRFLAATRVDEANTLRHSSESLEEVLSGQRMVNRLATGFDLFDSSTGGLNAGFITVIGARPSHGKSSLLRQIVAAGMKAKVPRRQFVFSTEVLHAMYMHQLAAELVGMHPDALTSDLRNGVYIDGMEEATSMLRDGPLWCDESQGPTPADIVRRIRSLADKNGPPDLVAIDHWHQLVHPAKGGKRESEAQREGSEMLRRLAKEMGFSLVIAAQLNREGDHGRPSSRHIRECDALVEAAAQIVMPYRPHFDASNPSREAYENAELVVTKNRFGKVGVVNCRWNGGLNRYV